MTAPAPVAGRNALAARTRGATAGVTRQGGRAVFSSSTAPKAAKSTKSQARPAAAAAPARSSAPARATRSASGDLWSGVQSAAKPSLASAASAGTQGGLGGGVVAGLVILGLGFAGVAGGVLVTGRRRRPARRGA